MQPLNCNPIESGVVQDDYRIGIQRKALEGQQGVVGLDDDIAGCVFILVWKHAAADRRLLGDTWTSLKCLSGLC